MRRLILLSFALALVAAPAAHAGGFATVGLSSTPEGVAPGEPWTVDITVLQHGRMPLAGVTPSVAIASDGTREEFAAKPTDKVGVYRAEVVFPTSGVWRYRVFDGFTDAMPHTFAPVEIGGEAAAPAAAVSGDGSATGWLLAAGAALALALLVLALDRRRHVPTPA